MMSCGRLCDPETAAEKKACNTTGRKTFLILYEYMCRRSQRGVKRDEWVGGLDYHGHRICQNSCPQGVREHQRSGSCSTSSSASTVSNDPRCRSRSSTSLAENAVWASSVINNSYTT